MAGDAENLLQKIPIESYIQRYVQLKRKGTNLWANCPFHSEKSPSFSVSPEKGIFKCFGCGKGGNLITFVQLYERVDFPEALRLLSEYSGIPLQGNRSQTQKSVNKKEFLYSINEKVKQLYQARLKQSDAFVYLKNRKISDEAVSIFQLGYAPNEYNFLEKSLLTQVEDKEQVRSALRETGLIGQGGDNTTYNRFQGRLIFPIFDVRGKTIAFGGRIIEARENTGKYVNSPESEIFSKKNNLYNLNRAKEFIRQAGQAIIVEGYLDVIGLSQAGIENVVAPLGTAFTEEQARLLKRYTDKVIFFLDNDEAGIEASFKSVLIARRGNLEARVLIQQQAGDPFDLSLKLPSIDILTLLDTSKSEMAFILWYFFFHKYNIKSIAEKRNAIEGFFEFLLKIENEWEKEDYLKESSSILEINTTALKNDFRKYSKTGTLENEKPKTEIRNEKIPGMEKEIISLLLKYPSFWQKQSLLDELQWTHRSIYLLFIFFRDRLKAGEFWEWEKLGNAINILPEELGGVLAEILIEMEDVFDSWEKNEKRGETNIETFFEKKLERLILMHKREKITSLLNDKLKELELAEKMQDPSSDGLTMEIDRLLREKTSIQNQLI